MEITDEIRKAFDDCTVMAGVENDFECVYITKEAALLYLNEIDVKYAKLRELVAEMFNACPMCVNCAHNHLTVGWYYRMRELGVEVMDE